MISKRRYSFSTSEKEDLRRCRQRMRWLMKCLGQSLPDSQTTDQFQSALLLNFHRASRRIGLTNSLGYAFQHILLPKTHKTATTPKG